MLDSGFHRVYRIYGFPLKYWLHSNCESAVYSQNTCESALASQTQLGFPRCNKCAALRFTACDMLLTRYNWEEKCCEEKVSKLPGSALAHFKRQHDSGRRNWDGAEFDVESYNPMMMKGCERTAMGSEYIQFTILRRIRWIWNDYVKYCTDLR